MLSPPLWPTHRNVQQDRLEGVMGVPGLPVPSWDGARLLLLLVGKERPCEVSTDSLCASTVPP